MTTSTPKYFLRIGSLIFLAIIFFALADYVGAWSAPNSPPTSPVDCDFSPSDPACALPLNTSSLSQVKAGPLGVSSVLVAFSNFFAQSAGIGPGFFNNTYSANDLYNSVTNPAGPVLFLDGKIKLPCSIGDCTGQVLVSNDSGLGDWQNGYWKRPSAGSPDIVNSNSNQKVFIDGALGRLGNTFTGTPSTQSTQINLGLTSTTGGTGSTVGGGNANTANADYSTVAGGEGNSIPVVGSSLWAFIGGGYQNGISGNNNYAVIGGGYVNTIYPDSSYSVIGGGQENSITSGQHSSIIGGLLNQITGPANFIGGGDTNKINNGSHSTIGGGYSNIINAATSTILGGSNNTIAAAGIFSVIGGGENNTVSSQYAVIAGGKNNLASGNYSVVPGGENNVAAGDYSFAGGRNMQLDANADNTFVWGANVTPTTISAPSSFLIFPNGNGRVGIGTANPNTAAVLDVNGGIRINNGSLVNGYVLTSDSSGIGSWQSLGSIAALPGESIVYIKTPDPGSPTSCSTMDGKPTGAVWVDALGGGGNSVSEFVAGAVKNNIRICIRNPNVASQVMYLKNPNPVTPPNCPSGWFEAVNFQENVSSGGTINNVKVCVR